MTSLKTFVNLNEKFDRTIVLIDMDCFYCQVEEFLSPDTLSGKPIAVVQYLENAGIIAVNYAARALGVTRHMREKEAKAVCKDLICVKVPSKNGKADLTKYRDAGYQVAKVLQTFTPLLERASIDEAYLDITENVAQKMQDLRNNSFQLQPSDFANTFAVGYESIGQFVQDVTSSVDSNFDDVPEEDRAAHSSSKLRLLIGSSIVNEIRRAVKEKTKYECSAGIAHNKILAKLTCAFNKPNKQTILPIESIPGLFNDLAVNKVKSLGGKLGEEVCQKLNVKTMSDILRFSEKELQDQFQSRVGSWLYLMARGIDLEKVTPKFMSKSIAVSKNFRGKNEIMSVHTLKFWLKELAKEVVERLEKDEADCNRLAKQMVVSFTQGLAKINGSDVSSSRTVQLNGSALNSYTAEQISDEALDVIRRNTPKFLKAEGTAVMNLNVKHLGIQAGKFEDKVEGNSKNLQNLLQNHQKRALKPRVSDEASTSKSPETRKVEEKSASVCKNNKSLQHLLQNHHKRPSASTENDESSTLKCPNASETPPRPPETSRTTRKNLQSPATMSKKKFQSPENESEIHEKPAKSPDLSRFQMKAPKILTKTPGRVNQKTLQENLSSKMHFSGDNAVKGIKTLEHWILELLKDAWEKIQKFLTEYPKSFDVTIQQIVRGKNHKRSLKFKISEFQDELVDSNVIVEKLKDEVNFLDQNGKLNPVSFLEITPTDLGGGIEWKIKIKDEISENIDNEVKSMEDFEAADEMEVLCRDDETDLFEETMESDDSDQEIEELNEITEDFPSPKRLKSISPTYSPTFIEQEEDIKDQLKDAEASFLGIDAPGPSNIFEKSYSHGPSTSLKIDSPGPSTSKNNQSSCYMSTYAEFQVPENISLDVLNPKEPCPECGKMVGKLDLMTHLDNHLAMQIASQQREEFRSQQKSLILQKKKPEKPVKTKNVPKTSNLILKYVKKAEKLDDEDDSNKIVCQQCHKLISPEDEISHLDYHFAQKLREEDLKSEQRPKVKPETNQRPKRPGSGQKNVPKMKSMKTYFSNP